MAVINRVPRGFLSLLDAKTQGRTPADIAQELQTTLDLTELYASDLTLEATATVGSVNPNLGFLENIVEIPAGEVWLVKSISGSGVQGAAPTNANQFVMAVAGPTGFGAHWLQDQVTVISSVAAFGQYIRAVNFDPWWVFGAGTQFGIWQTDQWTTAVSCTTSVLHYRVKV